jgi:hypothetical protein
MFAKMTYKNDTGVKSTPKPNATYDISRKALRPIKKYLKNIIFLSKHNIQQKRDSSKITKPIGSFLKGL